MRQGGHAGQLRQLGLGVPHRQSLQERGRAADDLAEEEAHLQFARAPEVHVGDAAHGHERAGQAETGGPGHHGLGPASRVGVEAVAGDGQLGLVRVPRHQAGVPLGHEARGGRTGRAVVGRRVRPHAHDALAQRPVHPQHGRHRGDGRHHHHQCHQEPEADQPPLRMVVQEGSDAGEEGEKAQHQGRQERDGDEPELAHHLAVEQARPDEVGQVAVEPLHAVEQRARPLPRLELGQQLLHDMVAERRVDRRARVLERVVGIELVAVDDADAVGPRVGLHHEVHGQRDDAHPDALLAARPRRRRPRPGARRGCPAGSRPDGRPTQRRTGGPR